MKQGTDYYFFQNDHLGTPQKLTAVNGAVVWNAKYSSFGKASIEIETVENNLRFPGQYYDIETDLHYNYHRYYDSKLGRYLISDPSHRQSTYTKTLLAIFPLLEIPQELNEYTFSRNNVVNVIDSFGLMGCRPQEGSNEKGYKKGGLCADQIRRRMARKDDYCKSDKFIFEDCTICCIELSQNMPNSSLVASTCSSLCQETLKMLRKKYCCE
jgi:RHS repeat-associated protein